MTRSGCHLAMATTASPTARLHRQRNCFLAEIVLSHKRCLWP